MELRKIQNICKNIVGLKVSYFKRCSDIFCIEIGDSYELQIKCAWKLLGEEGTCVKRGDIYMPSEKLYSGEFDYNKFDFDSFKWDIEGNNDFDDTCLILNSEIKDKTEQWKVSKIDINKYGELFILFDEDSKLETFISTSDKIENWRLIDLKTGKNYIVFENGEW